MRLLVVSVLCLVVLAFSFVENDVLQKIQLDLSNEPSPNERLFLHIDNNLVEQGKHVWFKAYLTEINQLKRSQLSQVLYVDLLTHQGDKVLECKYLIDSGRVGGAMFIPDSLENDNYILSAYTQELKKFNQGFTQILEVKRYASLFKNCKLVFDKPTYESGDKISFEIETLDINNDPIGKINYDYKLYNQGAVIRKGGGKTDKKGENSHELSFDNNQFLINPLVVITTSFDGKRSDFYFEIPRASRYIEDIKLYAEGGQFLNGRDNVIGFIATGKSGIPVSFHGHVVDQEGNQLVPVKSSTMGIGSFTFQPEENKIYHLQIANSEQKYELPQVKEEGYGVSLLDLNEHDNTAKFDIFRSKGLDPVVNCALVMDDKVAYFSTLNLNNQAQVEISLDSLDRGIAEFRLYNQVGVELASRRIFVNASKGVSFDFELPDNIEKAGEFVEVEIRAKDYLGQLAEGDFSVAVTEDFSLFHQGFNQPNIISSLLFESQLLSPSRHGNKFMMNNYYAGEDLNELLLVLDFEAYENQRNLSKSQSDKLDDSQDYVRGLVLDKNNEPQAGVDIVAIVKGSWDRNIITSDKFGFFQLPVSLLNGNSHGFIIGLADEKEYKNLKLRIEDNTYLPKSIRRLSVADINPESLRSDKNPNFRDARVLPGITVEDENYQEEFLGKKVAHYGNFTSMTRQGSQLNLGQDFLAYIRQITSVVYADRPNRGNIIFRGIPKYGTQTFGGGGYPALFVLDGVPMGYDYHDLDYLTLERIKSIDIIKSSSAVVTYGTRATGGVVIVKTGISGSTSDSQYFTQKKLEQNLINEFDRAVSVDYFEPARSFEDFNGLNDASLKTTLYWSEELVFDEDGVAKIRYRNTDLPSKIMININGISSKGLLGYGSTTYFANP